MSTPIDTIVSAFCDGATLESWFADQEKSIQPRMAAQIVATLAEAVQHAHQRGIIHRDLKPANVLVEANSDSLEANGDSPNEEDAIAAALRITDFGLARSIHSGKMNDNQTLEGAIIGTPAYMSPEQSQGSTDIGASTDVYSLGVILYELLTGRVPILGKSHIDTLMQVSLKVPQRPRLINKTIPADLEAICLKCLNKTTDQRYASAWDLSTDLNRWLNGQVVAARRPGVFERVCKWVVRNPALTTAIAAITIGLVVSGLQWRNARTHADRAQRNVSFAQETIAELVQRTSGDSSIPEDLRKELIEKAISLQTRLLEEEPGNNEILFQTAWAYRQSAVFLYDTREFQASLEALDFATDLHSQIDESSPQFNKLPSARLAIRCVRGNVLNALGRHDEAVQLFSEELVNDNPYELSCELFGKGFAKWRSGDLENGLIDLKNSAVLREAAGGDEVMLAGDLGNTLLYQGSIEHKLGLLAEAEETLVRALEKQTIVIGATSFHESMEETMGRIEYELGLIRSTRGNLDSAQTLLEQAEARFKMLSQWNQLKPKYKMSWFGVTSGLIDVKVKKGQIEAAAEGMAELESRFESYDQETYEYLDLGLRLAENRIEFGKHHKQDENVAEANAHFDKAEYWLDEMESKFPGDEAIADVRVVLSNAR